MNIVKRSIVIVTILMFPILLIAQPANKWLKQKTKFFYAAVNTQGGLLNVESEKLRQAAWSNQGVRNMISLQFLSKNHRLIQRSYTKSVALSAFFIAVNTELNNNVTQPSIKDDFYTQFRVNSWIQFSTKWDRTNFFIGTRGLPYGHNPRLDPFFQFLPNPARWDLGFGNDIGLHFRTPISKSKDLELAVTSGGFMKNPYFFSRKYNLEADVEQNMTDEQKKFVQSSKENYNGTYLISARVGLPTFRSIEFGLFAVCGKTVSQSNIKYQDLLARVGLDFISKVNERMKITQEITFGFIDANKYQNATDQNKNGIDRTTLNSHTALDYMHKGRILTGITNSIRFLDEKGRDEQALEKSYSGWLGGSIGYIFTPHAQVRVNLFSEYGQKKVHYLNGILFQAVIGLGQRS